MIGYEMTRGLTGRRFRGGGVNEEIRACKESILVAPLQPDLSIHLITRWRSETSLLFSPPYPSTRRVAFLFCQASRRIVSPSHALQELFFYPPNNDRYHPVDIRPKGLSTRRRRFLASGTLGAY